MINTIIFDLDGTLIESLTSIVASMNSILKNNGFPTHPFEDYRMFVGDGVEKLVERALPDSGKEMALKFTEEYVRIYTDTWREKTIPFDGIIEMLNELKMKGKTLMILSNKRDDLTKLQVNELFPEISFSDVRGAIADIPKKPDPLTALKMVNSAGSKPGETIFIGDSGVDMLTGVNAGMTSGGVLWGFRSREELKRDGANFLFQTPLDIVKTLLVDGI